MTKLGWIGGSLVAHATLLLLTVNTRAVSAPPDETSAQATWATDSDPNDESLNWVDVAAPMPDEPALPAAPAEVAPAEPHEPPQDEPSKTDAPSGEEPPARPVLPVERAPDGVSKTETKERVEAPAAKTEERSDRGAANPSNDGEDWLRIEDQLPESPKEPSTSQPKPEPRDPLVERLLAAERRKAADRRAEQSRNDSVADAPGPVQAPSVPTSEVVAKGPEDLADKFTRAVTQAEKANPVWASRDVGTVGSVRVWLRLESGVLQEPRFEPGGSELLEALVRRTLHLLRRGEFALPFSTERNGERLLEITVRLSEVDDVNRYAYEPPTKTRPGRAYFVLPDGRLFEAFVNPNPKP